MAAFETFADSRNDKTYVSALFTKILWIQMSQDGASNSLASVA